MQLHNMEIRKQHLKKYIRYIKWKIKRKFMRYSPLTNDLVQLLRFDLFIYFLKSVLVNFTNFFF
jgi:hypothetical protein